MNQIYRIMGKAVLVLRKSQGTFGFMGGGEKKEVKAPGSRGGKFYRTEKGNKVAYGAKPTAGTSSFSGAPTVDHRRELIARGSTHNPSTKTSAKIVPHASAPADTNATDHFGEKRWGVDSVHDGARVLSGEEGAMTLPEAHKHAAKIAQTGARPGSKTWQSGHEALSAERRAHDEKLYKERSDWGESGTDKWPAAQHEKSAKWLEENTPEHKSGIDFHKLEAEKKRKWEGSKAETTPGMKRAAREGQYGVTIQQDSGTHKLHPKTYHTEEEALAAASRLGGEAMHAHGSRAGEMLRSGETRRAQAAVDADFRNMRTKLEHRLTTDSSTAFKDMDTSDLEQLLKYHLRGAKARKGGLSQVIKGELAKRGAAPNPNRVVMPDYDPHTKEAQDAHRKGLSDRTAKWLAEDHQKVAAMKYDARVREYEKKGMTRSDAQGVVDAQDMKQGQGPFQPGREINAANTARIAAQPKPDVSEPHRGWGPTSSGPQQPSVEAGRRRSKEPSPQVLAAWPRGDSEPSKEPSGGMRAGVAKLLSDAGYKSSSDYLAHANLRGKESAPEREVNAANTARVLRNEADRREKQKPSPELQSRLEQTGAAEKHARGERDTARADLRESDPFSSEHKEKLAATQAAIKRASGAVRQSAATKVEWSNRKSLRDWDDATLQEQAKRQAGDRKGSYLIQEEIERRRKKPPTPQVPASWSKHGANQ